MCDEHEEIFNESGMYPDPWFQVSSSDYAELLGSDPAYKEWADSYDSETIMMMETECLNTLKGE